MATKQSNPWLRLIRPQSAGIVTSLIFIGLLLAGVTNILIFIIWGIFGFTCNTFGQVMNNVFDFEYDIEDPKKAHFPLVTGEIDVKTASVAILALFNMTVILALLMASAGISPWGLPWFVLALVSGTCYNYRSKVDTFGDLYFALSMSCLIPFAYLTYAGTPDIVVVWAFLFASISVLGYILFEGDLKDIQSDPRKLVYRLGVRFDTKCGSSYLHGFNYLHGTFKIAIMSTIMMLSSFMILYTMVEYDVFYSMIIFGIFFVALFTNLDMLSPGIYQHNQRMKQFVLKAMLMSLCFYVAVGYYSGIISTVLLFIYVITWTVITNRITWRTTIAPAV